VYDKDTFRCKEDFMNKKVVVTTNAQAAVQCVTGVRVRYLCPGDATGNAWSVSEITMSPEMGPPLHHHPWDEGYFVAEGEVSFSVGDRKILARSGEFVFVPGGTHHSFRGASEKDSRVIVFETPAASEAFFREIQREIKQWPQEAYKLAEIGGRHKVQFVHQ
jgi:mannose-6-phosphate isomerase-like protein (cupin superfamily)